MRYFHRSFTAVALLTLVGSAGAQRAPARDPLAGLDVYIERAMADWQVPGLAIAVVRGDSVVYARGFGVRELGGRGAVDEHTLFPIASTTKALTVGLLGMLVDEGKLRWDDRVSRHAPAFRLQDPWVTEALTVRDLLTHRAGISRSDNLWIVAPYERAEVLRRARWLAPPSGFRTEYGYNNLMYILAGEVAGTAGGGSWDSLMTARVFRPLGMTRSTTRAAVAAADGNTAGSHIRVDGKPVLVPRRNYENIGGAGAVFSSARDMAQWVRLHLNEGRLGGTELIKPATIREMHAAQTVMRGDSVAERMFPATNFRAYGLGWFLHDYHGRKVVHHSGSINWTRTHVAMIPAERIGVVAIANLNTSSLQQALMYRVLDALTGLPERDWSTEYLALARRGDERSAIVARQADSSRVAGTRHSLALAQYAGTYANDVYGEARVEMEDGRPVLRYSDDYTADLEHWHYDTFVARWRRTGFGRSMVTFTLDGRGRVATMDVDELGTLRRR